MKNFVSENKRMNQRYAMNNQLPGVFLVILLAAVFAFSGCKRDNFMITGNVTGARPGEYLLLREVKPGVLEPVDSAMPGKDGRFTFKSETTWPSFYMLSMGRNNFFTLLVSPGEKIELKARSDSLSVPASVKGSEGTAVMLTFQKEHKTVIDQLEHLNQIYDDSIMSPGLPLLMDSLDRKAADIIATFREKARKYLDDNSGSMVSVYLLNQQIVPGLQLFEPAKDPELFFTADSLLYSQFPESDLVLDLHSFVARLRENITLGNISGKSIREGDVLPEIALPDPRGDTLRLSSTRGEIVLVDFWAAWCPPCREENSNLVKLYDLYHNRGFEIFQVSLDLRKEDWTEAIRNDRLGRWMHVSDLKYRDSEVVKEFGLNEIPANFLIDRTGRVIGINLRGETLQKKLEEQFSRK
jgi:peroxiredoxin